MIFDLRSGTPKEVQCIYDTQFFASPENFADLGLDEFWTKVNDYWIQLVNDKSRDFYMMNRYEEDHDHSNLSKRKY